MNNATMTTNDLLHYMADTDIDDIITQMTFGNEDIAQNMLASILNTELQIAIVTNSIGTLIKSIEKDLHNWKNTTTIDEQINHLADYCELMEETCIRGTSKKRIVTDNSLEDRIIPPIAADRSSQPEFEVISREDAILFLSEYDLPVSGVYEVNGVEKTSQLTYASECSKYSKFIYFE